MTKDEFDVRYKSRILGILLLANRTPDARGLGIHADRWISELDKIMGEMWRAVEDAPLPVKPASAPTTPPATSPAAAPRPAGNAPAAGNTQPRR